MKSFEGQKLHVFHGLVKTTKILTYKIASNIWNMVYCKFEILYTTFSNHKTYP